MIEAEVDNVAREVGYYGDKDILLTGHDIYFRKEVKPNIELLNEKTGEMNTIVLPDETKDIVSTVEVIGVGQKCGTVSNDPIAIEMFGWPEAIVNPIKVGDRLLLPEVADSMSRPYGIYNEGIISEFDVIAILYNEDDADTQE